MTGFGEWALHEACRQAGEWARAGIDAGRVSVNVSGQQFAGGDLLTAVRSALHDNELPAERLVIELTEGILMEDPIEASATLRRICALGAEVSVDDFGTGYSSLSYLTRLPLDELKIDRSFVQTLPADEDNAAVVATIIALAHELRLRVVAEGVETEQQLRFLRERGCEQYQGFLFARPTPADEFTALLDSLRG